MSRVQPICPEGDINLDEMNCALEVFIAFHSI